MWMRGLVVCRQTVELALTIRQAFESSILLELYQRAQIDMFVHILETDGGQSVIHIAWRGANVSGAAWCVCVG